MRNFNLKFWLQRATHISACQIYMYDAKRISVSRASISKRKPTNSKALCFRYYVILLSGGIDSN